MPFGLRSVSDTLSLVGGVRAIKFGLLHITRWMCNSPLRERRLHVIGYIATRLLVNTAKRPFETGTVFWEDGTTLRCNRGRFPGIS